MHVAISLLMTRASTQRRILSIGDLHGDFLQTSGLLRNLGLMDAGGGWTGGQDVLIQTGDIADRGHQEMDVYKALFRLQDEAPASGGEVIMLLGNHELMNLQGDYSYADTLTGALHGETAKRTEEFGPKGWLGKQLRRRSQVVARIGEKYGFTHPVLYAHAGILPTVAEAFDHRSNSSGVEDAGEKAADLLNAAVRRRLSNRTWTEIRDDNSSYFTDTGPLWTRHLARSLDAGLCVELEQSLQIFGATRMVVGHTPQVDGKVHHRCRGRLVLADTVISSAYAGGGHPSAVEVRPGGQAFAIYPEPLLDHLYQALPVVDPLIAERALDVIDGGLTPQLRWQLQVLGLDIKGEHHDALNSASTLPTVKQVRSAYRRLSLARHPDKGGTLEDFRELQAAFEGVLRRLGVA
jgi:hypothetical protein